MDDDDNHDGDAADELVAEAQDAVFDGDFSKCAQLCESMVAKFPREFEAYALLVDALLTLGGAVNVKRAHEIALRWDQNCGAAGAAASARLLRSLLECAYLAESVEDVKKAARRVRALNGGVLAAATDGVSTNMRAEECNGRDVEERNDDNDDDDEEDDDDDDEPHVSETTRRILSRFELPYGVHASLLLRAAFIAADMDLPMDASSILDILRPNAADVDVDTKAAVQLCDAYCAWRRRDGASEQRLRDVCNSTLPCASLARALLVLHGLESAPTDAVELPGAHSDFDHTDLHMAAMLSSERGRAQLRSEGYAALRTLHPPHLLIRKRVMHVLDAGS